MNLVSTEIRRALRRRAVRVLILIAVLGSVVAGTFAFFDAARYTTTQLLVGDDGHPAVMADWWAPDGDSLLGVAAFFLLIGGLFGGATVVGAEWRAGTVATVLTWEPRRIRLHVARVGVAALLAFVISFVLQVVFLASFLPAVLVHGTTEGADGELWVQLGAAALRISGLTALATVLAASLATLGRNTAFAVIVVFTWMAVIENAIRGLRPSLAEWLWGENVATVLTWAQMSDVDFTRGPLTSMATVIFYCSVIAVAAAIAFGRRDIAAAT